jgi:hypothetical protein
VRGFIIAFIGIAFSGLMPLTLRAQTAPFYNIDTVRSFSPGCDTLPVRAYFQVKGKYPESPQTLARWADSAIRNHQMRDDARGYITFRVLIDCAGKLAAIKLLQTDERYEPHFFSKGLVDDLYAFLQSLKDWKKASAAGRPVNYYSYLSFKIEDGHVVQVSP